MPGINQRSYSEVAKNKKKESILIVTPKTEQKSEITKQMVKDKI